MGVINAPGERYHPAIVAQATATLCEMYPGRFWLALGSGEFLNEHITGSPWPRKDVRHRRLQVCAAVMKQLWAGETVTRQGEIRCDRAKLYTRPNEPPMVLEAALTPETAEWLGGWADGLITAGKKHADLQRIIEAFNRGGGEGKPLYLQAALAFADSDEEALADAHELWRVAGLSPTELADVATPREFDELAQEVTADTIRERLRVSADWRVHADWILQDFELGFDAVFLNHVGRNPNRFIDMCGDQLLSYVRK